MWGCSRGEADCWAQILFPCDTLAALDKSFNLSETQTGIIVPAPDSRKDWEKEPVYSPLGRGVEEQGHSWEGWPSQKEAVFGTLAGPHCVAHTTPLSWYFLVIWVSPQWGPGAGFSTAAICHPSSGVL